MDGIWLFKIIKQFQKTFSIGKSLNIMFHREPSPWNAMDRSAQVSRLMPGPVATGKWLVAIVVSLTPTANNIMVQAVHCGPGSLPQPSAFM